MELTDNSFWAGRRVLLTGHTGFKGSWLSLWLQKMGAQVHGVGLPPELTSSLFEDLHLKDKIASHKICDIRDYTNLLEAVNHSQPDVVFHLAAQALVRRSFTDPLGTWSTNLQGSLNLLESLKSLNHRCAVVMVTTDKVYSNREWVHGYREEDQLGGHDPYSSSKACAELAIDSWRSSFCGKASYQTANLAIATARAGNVIGGGDWAPDRILPDLIRALTVGESVLLRNPFSTRPWQHVLEPLSGYIKLAELLYSTGLDTLSSAFNFGPTLESNRPVIHLVEEAFRHWPGSWLDISDPHAPHEANRLHLQIDKSFHYLGWRPCWDFSTTIERTVNWYKSVNDGSNPLECCLSDLETYIQDSSHGH